MSRRPFFSVSNRSGNHHTLVVYSLECLALTIDRRAAGTCLWRHSEKRPCRSRAYACRSFRHQMRKNGREAKKAGFFIDAH